MKHFRLKIILTVILTAILVTAFSWIITWQNYRKLSDEASKEKPLNREAVNYTLKNLSDAWNDYEQKIRSRYAAEEVFSSLADDSVRGGTSGEGGEPENRGAPENSGEIDDIVKEAIDIPGTLKRTELACDVSAMFLPCDPENGKTFGEFYKNDRYFSDCESIGDLGLTVEDLEKNGRKASGTLTFDGVTFSYVSGASSRPAGYVILLEPVPNLYAKAFGQAGYMIAALIVLLTVLLVAGFSLYPYVRGNILTPDEEKVYHPSHVRSLAALFGVLGLIVIALCGMLIYALNGLYDDVSRGKERLASLDDSLALYTGSFSQNRQAFEDIYLEFGNHIAQFLDNRPELRDRETLSKLAQSISASSITLYDADGRETVSSGPWIGLELGTDPDSTTYDFRRILTGVPSIIHNQETDEQTGLNEMRLGVRIRDDADKDRYGVMMLTVDIQALSGLGDNPEKAVREILQHLSDSGTKLWIADAKTGRILVSDSGVNEGKNITDAGLSESDLKGSLVRTLKTEEGTFFVTSASMDTAGLLEWAGAPEGIIAYYQGPKTSVLPGMLGLVLTGCVLFALIYMILAWIILKGYTVEFFEANRHVKGDEDRQQKKNPLFRSLGAVSPGRRGVTAMEIATAVFLIQMMVFIGSGPAFVRSSVYYYISAGDWERGFNLFAAAAILILLSKVVLLVIAIRLLASVCSAFAGSRGKTIFRLLASIVLYISLFFFLIRTFEYLGFSRTAIAAGMGSLALAISLGSQNFVADIFAGLTYVFEGTVHVGDSVEIAVSGSPVCQGKVMEIGVRCMKILTREGDLITCGNRAIGMIKNSTQMNSRVICVLTVSSELSAEEIEEMMKEKLPDVGRTDRRILNGPTYNGISGISNGTMTLSVSAECSEEDYFYVRDKLNVSLQRIFREKGYSI